MENPISEWSEEDGPKEKLSKRCEKFLKNKASMLDDYFSIKIVCELDENNKERVYLHSIPILLENYEPDLSEMALFIIRLATEVNWKNEKECFDSICRQLAIFYSLKNLVELDDECVEIKKIAWVVEHVLYAAFRNMLLLTDDFEKDCFFKLVDLSRLYRVFERC